MFALALLLPAPSVGVLCGMVLFPNSLLGTVLFGASKVWLFGLPAVWLKWVDRQPYSLSVPRHGGLAMGLFSGLAISAFILAAFLAFAGTFIDRGILIEKLRAIGLGSPAAFAGGAAYWILVNSVLEEYVWRWFCFEQFSRLMQPRPAALCAAAGFTLHHAVALSVYMNPAAVLLCSLGVFAGGAIWSLMYARYRSIWPGYLSHAIVDLCIFGLGAYLLFPGSA
jgi:uncharacterized protein